MVVFQTKMFLEKKGAGLLFAGGNVNLTGGTISNKNENKSDSINGNGGKIYADPVANINMSSGQISNCKVDKADNLWFNNLIWKFKPKV